MFRTFLSKSSSYLKYGPRLLTFIPSRSVTLSSVRLCDVDNLHDDFRDLKHAIKPEENRALLKADSESEKSVLFEMHRETLTPLNACSTVEEVLHYLKCNQNISFHLYGHIFNTIFKLYKSGKTKLSAEDICRTEVMQKFSINVNRNVRFLKVENAVTILKVLTSFGISTNSILCQSLLQMISKQVNRLGVAQIMFLHFIIPEFARSPLVDALKIAIPIVFEAHVRSQLDEDDIPTVVGAVCFAFQQEEISEETRELLVNVALDKIDKIKLTEAVGIVRRLRFTDEGPENVQTLYWKLMNILRENVDQLEPNYIVKIVRVTVNKYLNVHERFFDETLVKMAVEIFIKNKVSLEHTGLLLREFDRISYYCPNLLDYVDEQFVEVANFNRFSHTVVHSFVKACANCSHKPKNWNSYEPKILSHLEEQKDSIPDPLIALVTDLMVIKCWPKTLVPYCFREDYLSKLLGKGKPVLHALQILSMYHAVKLLYSDYYAGPYPPAHILDKAVSVVTGNADKEYPLLGALEVGLGGSQYILNGVQTKLGQIIDYLIVKCKTGELYPISAAKSLDGETTSYESLQMPPNSYPIALVLLRPTAYCLDGLRMRGKTIMLLKCLEAYGITAIPISYYQWLELHDSEKIPYLIDRIDRSVPVTSSREFSSSNF